MKKLKKLALLPLAFLMIIGISSCKDEDDTPVDDPTQDVFTDIRVSTIDLDTTNVKKEYYLGEEFTSENLKVYANYVKTKADNSTEQEKVESTDFSVNTENIDMNTCGTYPVEVIYRDGTKVITASYDIVVKSTILAESGLEYVGGLEVTYNGKKVDNLLLNSTFTFDIKKVKCTLHYFKSGAEVSTKTIAYTKIVADASAVDTSKNGDYMIKYTYTGDDIVVGATTVKNVVTTYTIIRVSNPVTSLEKITTNDTTFSASTENLDFTKWKFRINRKVESGTQEVNFNYDLFTISGGISFIEGTTTIEVTLIEDDSMFVQVPITVTESTTQDIKVYTDLSAEQQTVEGTTIKISTDNVLSVNNFTDNSERVNSDGSGKDSYNGVRFNRRIKIEPKYNGTISVNMEKTGTIVLFVAKAADSVDPLEILASLTGDDTYEIPSQFITPVAKQTIVALSFDVEKAGIYTFKSAAGSVYFHGAVIATNK